MKKGVGYDEKRVPSRLAAEYTNFGWVRARNRISEELDRKTKGIVLSPSQDGEYVESIRRKKRFGYNAELVSVENEGGFRAQDKTTVGKDGTCSTAEFSKGGNPLTGSFLVTVSMSLPRLQAQSVQDIIGSKGEYITGRYVEKDDITNSNWVYAEFKMNF